MRKLPLVLAISLACASFVSNAAAQSDKSIAEALFRAGKDLEKAGRVAEACPKYVESHRLDPKPGTILNVATCHESIGRTATAWADYGEAATFAGRAKQAERERFARGKVAELEKRLSYVSFVFPDVKGLEVTLDGKAFNAGGTRIPLDPGDHAVGARATGKTPWNKTLVVEPGPAEKTFEIPILDDDAKGEPTATAPPPKDIPEAVPNGTQRTLGWVALGIGVVGVGVGFYFGVRTLKDKSDRDAHCTDAGCDNAGIDLDRSARTNATVSTIGFIAGGVLVVTGIVLVLTGAPTKAPSVVAGVSRALSGSARFVW